MSKIKWFYGNIDYIEGYGRFCRCAVITTSKKKAAKIANISMYHVNTYWSEGEPYAGSGNTKEKWPDEVIEDTLYIRIGTKGNGATPNAEGPPWKWIKNG